MQILWRLKKGFVRDIIEELPDPKPAYNTISTIVRILEKKGFVGYNAFGKTHEYFPLIDKETYSDFYLNRMIKNYFGGSFSNLVSFFARENKLDVKDLNQLLHHVKGTIEEENKDE